MRNHSIKILSLLLLASVTLSFPILKIEGQGRNLGEISELTFFGKEETKWIEKRDVPMPNMVGQGVKEEPYLESFDLREDSVGPTRKITPPLTQPGCAHSNRLTAGASKTGDGDESLYRKGRYHYFEKGYEDAISTFQQLIREYPDSPWKEAALYWIALA